MTDKSPNTNVTETDVLVSFELQNLPDEFREYYKIKRVNFFASIQNFRFIWNVFLLLDEIWVREFSDFGSVRDVNQMFPLTLYKNAHCKVRLAAELGFSTCVAEAYSIMRDAVESCVHAHRLIGDPQLAAVWLGKDEGKTGYDAYRETFEREKKQRLFAGLGELHDLWTQFSEGGSHTTVQSLLQRFVEEETDTHVQWRLNYVGVSNELVLAGSLFTMLMADLRMEELMFKDLHERLRFDAELIDKRIRFNREKERCRQRMVSRYNIQRPSI